MAIRNCPLQSDLQHRLRTTFIKFQFSSPEEEALLKAAHQEKLGLKLHDMEAKWEIGPHDASSRRQGKHSHFYQGFPCHLHTEFEIEGKIVHVDRIWANMWGPGRWVLEFHIFIDGKLAGFGGSSSSSLGYGLSIKPAVALIDEDKALVVTERSRERAPDMKAVQRVPDSISLFSREKGR